MGLQLTRGGEYAVRAMTYLARFPEGHVASLRDIGRAQDIPESFLAKILQSLVRSGLAVSQRGAHGGFALARPAAGVTMRDIIEAVDGPIAHLALLMVFTLFIPFLALMTTLAAFKVLSPLLGGDVEISLLSRLI